MSYQLSVPTFMETAVSGYVGAIEKSFRNKVYRVEFWNHGVLCSKDGTSIVWDDLPVTVRKDAHSGCEQLKQGLRMRAEAVGAVAV